MRFDTADEIILRLVPSIEVSEIWRFDVGEGSNALNKLSLRVKWKKLH